MEVNEIIGQEVARARAMFTHLPRSIDADDLRMAAVTAILKLSGKESEGLLRIIIRRAIQQEIRRSLRGGGEMSEMKVDVAAKLPRSICEAAVKDALSKLPFAEGQMLSSMYYGKETVSSIAKNTKRTRAEVVKVYRSAIDHLKEVLRG